MAYTFKGGVRVEEYKSTSGSPIEKIPDPPLIKVSMNQHIGVPSVPVVKPGEHVLRGQMIADVPNDSLGCPVHSGISGTVRAVEEIKVPSGAIEKTVVIENDGKYLVPNDICPYRGSIGEISPEEIVSVIRKSGITGMGGAAFPTYAKVSSAMGKAELIIVNCAECEPFITADHRLLLEKSDAVIGGVKILMKACGVGKAYIAIENNKLDAANLLEEILVGNEMISVKVMKTKYPQGDERQLIYALTGRELPSGSLPADAGCVIFNAGTCAAVYTAFAEGMPLVDRVITVSGDCIRNPKNLLVPIGTPASFLAEYCGGFVTEPVKMISGGPMMGQAQWDRDMPVKKSTSSILYLSDKIFGENSQPPVCIRCGRCVASCPMHLMPAYIAQSVQRDDMKSAEKFGAMSCVECGSCSYICPGKIELVQYIRTAKNYIKTEAFRTERARRMSEE